MPNTMPNIENIHLKGKMKNKRGTGHTQEQCLLRMAKLAEILIAPFNL